MARRCVSHLRITAKNRHTNGLHVFGMKYHVDPECGASYYNDPCCIMSQNGPFVHPTWQRNFGPARCLLHLMQRDRMYRHRAFVDDGGWMSQPGGITLPLAPTSRPFARANLGIKLGAFARSETSWDYYLEHAIATDWNRGSRGAPYLFIRRMSPKYARGTPEYMGFISISPTGFGQIAELVEPLGNVRFQAQLTNLPGPMLKVTAKKL